MANDTVRMAEKGPMTRSSREALSKKVVTSGSATLNRKSERVDKRMPPSPAVKMDQKRKTTTPSPLRRSERTKNASLSDASASKSKSSGSKKHFTGKQLVFEASGDGEEGGSEASSRNRPKRMTTGEYLALFVKPRRVDLSDSHEEANGMDRSTQEGDCHEKTNGNDRPTQEDCLEKTNSIDMSTQDCHEKTNGNERPTQEDCLEKSNQVDRLTQEGDDGGGRKIDGEKIDECLNGNCLDYAKDDKVVLPSEDATGKEMITEPKLSGPVKELLDDNVTVNSLVLTNASTCEPSRAHESFLFDSGKEETLQMLGLRDSVSNENLIRKCVEHDKGEKSISSKRKRTVVDMQSDGSAMLADNDNSNLIEDVRSSRICGNVVETNGSCSKRIRRISLSDVKKDWRKTPNNVDEPSSKSNGEKVSTRNKEGSERPQGNTVETEKIRKQQKSLHLLLKPEIANLCEILCLPDNVKSMVEKCLEYTMNNYQICTEPVSILQAFQLSLCWTAASLLNHKLNFEASLALAKQHLNFDCKKEVVDEINSRLLDLKESFLSLTGNSNVATYPKASESSNGVQLVKHDTFKNIKVVQKRKSLWNKLLLKQQEEKQKLKKDIENETADFRRRYHIEWAAIHSFSPNYGTKEERLKIFKHEYEKRMRELERQHEICRKDLEAKQLETRLIFQESSAPDELLNPVALHELGPTVDSLQIRDQVQHHNALIALMNDHGAEVKGFNDTVEVMTRNGTRVSLSEDLDATNASAAVPCGSTVEVQTPPVKHADADEMDIVASKDGPASGNKCNYIAENEYDSQGNIISTHSKSKEQSSDGDTSMPGKGEGCVNFSHESLVDFGQDAITRELGSSNNEICDGETLDVPSGDVTPRVCNASSSHDDRVEIPSYSQGKLDMIILSKPVCGSSIEVEANGSNDGAKNIAPLISQSCEELIPSVNTMSTPNCENAAQIQETDDNYGSNNADTLNSSFSNERISSNSKSPQDHIRNENVMYMLNNENFAQIDEDDHGSGSNNAILNLPLIDDERNSDRTVVLDSDAHVVMLETVNITPSTEQISGGAVDVSVLDNVLSTSYGADSPNNSSDANAIAPLNQLSLEKQNHGVSSSIPAGQIPVEVSDTCHERATVNILDQEEAAVGPGTAGCTNYTENIIPLISSSKDQISNGGPVLDRDLSSGHYTTSPSNSRTLPDKQIPVFVPENSHEEAECQSTDSRVVHKNATSNQQEGVFRTMSESSLSQETPVSRPVDLMQPLELVQPLSSVESPLDQVTAREMQNTLGSPVDIAPANQSINDSPVMEPPAQEGQLRSAGFLSSNQALSNLPLVTETEDQPSNEDDLPNHIPETSIEFQNQAVVQCAPHVELDSCSRQVVQPASNMDLDSLLPGGVRLPPSDTRNLSTLTEINNHLIQPANQSASRIIQHLCHDPLSNELERLRRLTEQNMKDHENRKLQLKCDFEKELEELYRKYDIKRKEIEVEHHNIRKNLDTRHHMVIINRILAEAFRAKSMDLKVTGASRMQQDTSFAQQLMQTASQQSATRPSMVACPSSCRPPAASLQSSYATTTSQTMVPPIQGTFSSVSPGLPHINTLSSPLGNVQSGGGEIRAPPPHLQHYRPPTSVPVSSLCTVPQGRQSHPAPANIPVISPPFSHRTPRPMPATFQSLPHRGHWPVSTGGSSTPNLSAMNSCADANSQPAINLPNVRPHMPDLASLNLSKFGTSSSTPADQATSPDVVCLSDDE